MAAESSAKQLQGDGIPQHPLGIELILAASSVPIQMTEGAAELPGSAARLGP